MNCPPGSCDINDFGATPGVARLRIEQVFEEAESCELIDSSFIELNARERARMLLDDGSFRELLGPFERIVSPWLEPQGIVAAGRRRHGGRQRHH